MGLDFEQVQRAVTNYCNITLACVVPVGMYMYMYIDWHWKYIFVGTMCLLYTQYSTHCVSLTMLVLDIALM